MFKRIFLILLSMIIFFQPVVVLADTSDIGGVSYILMSGDTGQVLMESNSDMQWYPASTTKIMTLVLALEAVESGVVSLDDTVRISEYAASMTGSIVYLKAGEERTLNELLIGIAVGSGNDAAVAVAEYIGGTEEKFVTMMNDKAAELGMVGTHFVNPHGLHDDDHYTTAADMGVLAFYAISETNILEYTSIYEYEFIPEPNLLTLWNTNRLLKWYSGTDGLKTGYTEEAGRNLVSTVVRDDMRLIAVVLGVEEANGHFSESMKLLNIGFNSFEYQVIQEAGEVVCSVPVIKGESETIEVITADVVGGINEKSVDEEYTTSIDIPVYPVAPVEAGDIIGTMQIYCNESIVAEVDLIAKTSVEKIDLMNYFVQNVIDIFSLK